MSTNCGRCPIAFPLSKQHSISAALTHCPPTQYAACKYNTHRSNNLWSVHTYTHAHTQGNTRLQIKIDSCTHLKLCAYLLHQIEEFQVTSWNPICQIGLKQSTTRMLVRWLCGCCLFFLCNQQPCIDQNLEESTKGVRNNLTCIKSAL